MTRVEAKLQWLRADGIEHKTNVVVSRTSSSFRISYGNWKSHMSLVQSPLVRQNGLAFGEKQGKR
jgi:hypothetical protein